MSPPKAAHRGISEAGAELTRPTMGRLFFRLNPLHGLIKLLTRYALTV